MKKTFYIKNECVAYILYGLSTRTMTLKQINSYLSDNNIKIPIGQLRAILTTLNFLGLVTRKITYKKHFKYSLVHD